MKKHLLAVAILTTLAGPVAAQEWKLDDSLKAFTDREMDRLLSGVEKAPEKALKDLLEEEGEHLEDIAKEELEEFAHQAWGRILSGREEGRLWSAIRDEFQAFGVVNRAMWQRAWLEERTRAHAFPERIVYGMVDRVLKAVLIDRLTAVRDARLVMARVDRSASDSETPWSWREAGDSESGIERTSWVPIPRVKFFTHKSELESVLYKETFKSKLGDLKVTALELKGLAEAKAGRLTYKDDFGNEVEGLGVTFTAKASLTGLRADYRSPDLVDAHKNEFGIKAYMSALAKLATNVEASNTTVVNERGIGTHTVVRAGAGVSASARLPIVIDLKVVTLRVIPYASAHAGVSAEAHATLEVEYTGKLRVDLGASFSTGVGVGAGVVIEIELGPMLKRGLTKLIKKLARFSRPIADKIMGRKWRGPPVDSDRVTLSLADLERRWAQAGAPTRAPLTNEGEVAARYAPIIYQRVTRGAYDLLRRVDFDGDWDTTNNWNNTSDQADSSAWVYYDVRETETHWFVTYVLYHSGRFSNGIRPFSLMRRHENDMGGCIVVVRKDADPGREVEVLMTANGDDLDVYSGLEPRGPDKIRWKRRYGSWHGSVQFVDEVDHPNFDLDRTHPQVWVGGKNHDVHGFTGRDDRDPFSRKDGVVYYPTGTSERPESFQDEFVGYALRPLDELLEQVQNGDVFTTDELTEARPGHVRLPGSLRGDEGRDNAAVPPWAWRAWVHEEDDRDDENDSFRREKGEYLVDGDLFIDPALTLSLLFRTPEDFSRTYLDNPYLVGGPRRTEQPRSAETSGLSGALDDQVGD